MISKRVWKAMVPALALITLSIGVSAWAHGARDHRPGGVRDVVKTRPAVLHFGRLIDRLIHPCRAACLDTAHSCVDDAESAAVECAETTCATEIQDATTACATERSSEACMTAVTALKTCVQPCAETQSTELMTCRTAQQECLSDCAAATATPTPGEE